MDMQSAAVVVISLVCVVFLARKYFRAAKGGGGCGCGCGQGRGCPVHKRHQCASQMAGIRLGKRGGC
ncbi:MAG: FeoB-associated Cys-rich membrane protein [Candidatus Adiutrix sp.]|jgi:hypothetical protein|nr:FeoB-associated Cys-rich membrane protein [Candidatus Adiutrix sp.]